MKVKIGAWYVHRYGGLQKLNLWTNLDKAQDFTESQINEYMPAFEEIAKVSKATVELIESNKQPAGQLQLFA